MQFCRNDSRQLVYSMVDNTGANRPMFSQLDQHGAFTPCCTRSASPFPSVSRVAGARPRSFDDLSLFLFRKPFFPRLPPPSCFCEGLPRGSNGVRTLGQVKTVLFDRAMKISLWVTFGLSSLQKLRPSEPCSSLRSTRAYRQLFLLSSFVVCIIDEKKVSPLVLRTGTRYCSGRVYIYYLLFVPRRSIGWITLTASIVSFGICVRRLAFVSRSRAFQDSWFLSWPTYSPGFARND